MVRSLVALLIIGSIAFPLSQAQKWVQVWGEEFDGPEIDRSKWNFEVGNEYNTAKDALQYFNGDDKDNSFI